MDTLTVSEFSALLRSDMVDRIKSIDRNALRGKSRATKSELVEVFTGLLTDVQTDVQSEDPEVSEPTMQTTMQELDTVETSEEPETSETSEEPETSETSENPDGDTVTRVYRELSAKNRRHLAHLLIQFRQSSTNRHGRRLRDAIGAKVKKMTGVPISDLMR